MAEAFHYFPLDAYDWLLSDDVGDMTAEEEGVYIRLLCIQWVKGSIPGDPEAIARTLKKRTRSPFAKVWENLERLFPYIGDTQRRANLRLEHEREKVERKRRTASDNASNRWKTAKNGDAPAVQADSGGNAGAMLGEERRGTERKDPPVAPTGGQSAGGDLFNRGQHSEQAKKPRRRKEPPPIEKHRAAATHVLDALNAARKRVNPRSRGIGVTDEALVLIAERLEAGATVDDCLHVVAVCEAECAASPSAFEWFDAVSPWRPENFQRKVARPSEPVDDAPRPIRLPLESEVRALVRDEPTRALLGLPYLGRRDPTDEEIRIVTEHCRRNRGEEAA